MTKHTKSMMNPRAGPSREQGGPAEFGAGAQRPGNGTITGRLRSIGGADTPHIQVRYALTQGPTVVASGEEHLGDLNYLRHGADIVGDDPLKAEKRVLEAWFKQRFVEKKPAAAK